MFLGVSCSLYNTVVVRSRSISHYEQYEMPADTYLSVSPLELSSRTKLTRVTKYTTVFFVTYIFISIKETS
jgi:hypothetical protein